MTSREQLIKLVHGKRWYGDKTRSIVDAEVIWSRSLSDVPPVDLVVVRYSFASGEPSHYLMAIDRTTGEDRTTSRSMTDWLAVVPDGLTRTDAGLSWQAFPGKALPPLANLAAADLGVEQSNTSIRYGDQVLVKVNRRLSSGRSPEVELAAVTAKAPDATYAAHSFGALMLQGVLPEETCLAIYSAFVPNAGDAWHELLTHLRAGYRGYEEATACAAAIGETTARMHLGLLSDPWRAEVAAEPLSTAHIEHWIERAQTELHELVSSLTTAAGLTGQTKALRALLPGAHEALLDQISGMRGLAGTHIMRVHGDYHLGQILRASNDGYAVVDFDGEPHRSLEERRQKYSALRDVAGMLRSFSYARGTVERETGLRAELGAWEAEARTHFLEAYVPIARAAPFSIIPKAGDDIRRALNALEIEKAVYECGYELNNRPDWLWLPLTRLVQSR